MLERSKISGWKVLRAETKQRRIAVSSPLRLSTTDD